MDGIQEEHTIQEQTPSQDLMAHRHHFGRGHLMCLYFQKGLIGLTMSQLSAKTLEIKSTVSMPGLLAVAIHGLVVSEE